MENKKADSRPLCCGNFFFAEIVDTKLELECTACGSKWQIESGAWLEAERKDRGGS